MYIYIYIVNWVSQGQLSLKTPPSPRSGPAAPFSPRDEADPRDASYEVSQNKWQMPKPDHRLKCRPRHTTMANTNALPTHSDGYP